MTDSVTGQVKLILVPGAGYSDLVEQEELEDIVLEFQERFEAELKGVQPRKLMPRQDQHDLGKLLQDIRESHQRRRKVLHGRFW